LKKHAEGAVDKAGQQYWNDLWAGSEMPAAVDPADRALHNWINRRYHRLFQRLFAGADTSRMRLLEIGCGKSAWLPYFAREFGFSVGGLDYSPVGCHMARDILEANGVRADVVCADLFAPPSGMVGQFDVVVSFGVVEHFEDTAGCLAALARLLKPGGMLITTIPNLVGWIGSVQKRINRPVYDIHQLIDPARLRGAHEQAGLVVMECDYFVFTNFGVCNLAGVPRSPLTVLKKIVLAALARLSMLLWRLEDRIGDLPPRRSVSPYIRCIARKP
jgi:2-polyprenyl-3-methyl-5-hydroxy-6-metoxy-1,4-benzoquinol methylase